MSSLSRNPTRQMLAMEPSHQHRGEVTGRDGFERFDVRGYDSVRRMEDRIARERRVEALRACIHRCDSGVIA